MQYLKTILTFFLLFGSSSLSLAQTYTTNGYVSTDIQEAVDSRKFILPRNSNTLKLRIEMHRTQNTWLSRTVILNITTTSELLEFKSTAIPNRFVVKADFETLKGIGYLKTTGSLVKTDLATGVKTTISNVIFEDSMEGVTDILDPFGRGFHQIALYKKNTTTQILRHLVVSNGKYFVGPDAVNLVTLLF